MTVRVGINGFGRIGRNFLRAVMADPKGGVEVVACNDLQPLSDMAYLLEYDSVFGRLPEPVEALEGELKVGKRSIKMFAEREPKEVPWGDVGADVVVESTGFFTKRELAAQHLDAGAKRVVISAPGTDVDATFVYGVNHQDFDGSKHQVVSNASCTTNCFVPMVKVLDDAFGIERGLMTTIHAYTATQALIDGAGREKGQRDKRAAALNLIPATTGAARATSLVLESMKGKLDGQSMRVPVPDGSFTDFTALLSKETTVDEVNEAFRAAASGGPLSAGILVYSTDPIVSSDIVGSTASCTFDAPLTMAIGNLVKVGGWYDNEWGYSNRLLDLIQHIGSTS
ncbi:MAG TPA: type I glyceraldehyde-3-phosphate dehydrogenase [Acidimicrobiales bacterium]|nr:type I glyceraldehyde-3-phosphate dehydrogenase [Acidimicrobiales bacterium]